jgi:hypothetical protein
VTSIKPKRNGEGKELKKGRRERTYWCELKERGAKVL